MPHKTTNAEKCRAYKEGVAQDPILLQELKEKNKEAARRYRQKQKNVEQLTHQKQLQRERQKRYEEKKKARAQQASEAPRPQTRLDREQHQKKDLVRIAVQKHRANQTSQKKRRVNEKRMAYYYRKKEARALEQAKLEKASQAELAFQSSGSPYPNQDAFKRAVRRVRQKIKAKGKKFAFLFKGLVKTADKITKEALENLNVRVKTPQKNALNSLHEHISSIKSKRDKKTLSHKRRLAEAFLGSETEAVFNQTYLKSGKVDSAYSRQKENKIQHDIREFFHKNASEDPCKISRKKAVDTARE